MVYENGGTAQRCGNMDEGRFSSMAKLHSCLQASRLRKRKLQTLGTDRTLSCVLRIRQSCLRPMIKSIIASNYKSLGPDTKIDFGPLTVLVGQNGAGKSNVIDVFRFVSNAMKMGLEGAITTRHGIKAIRRWSNGRPYNVSIKLEVHEGDGYSATYQFTIGGHRKHEYGVVSESATINDPTHGTQQFIVESQRWTIQPEGINPALSPMSLALPLIAGDERYSRLETALRNCAAYNIYPDTLRSPQKYDPAKPLNEHGLNWTSILKDQDESQWKDDLVNALNRLTGEIDDMEIQQLTGYLIARFRHGKGGDSQKPKWFDASQESDGTLRVAGILTALLQRPAVPLMIIEEPELTIHPGAIRMVYEYLEQASRDSQILVATHSPELLDAVSKPEQIRVVIKDRDKTLVEHVVTEQINAVKEGLYSLGELHRSEGLKGATQLTIFPEDVSTVC
jgi:predicted ATPase